MSATPAEIPVFTVERHLDAPPDRVFAAFIDPQRLERWFVVDGFSTPAERIRSTPTPGGGVEAVMVSDADRSASDTQCSTRRAGWCSSSTIRARR